MIIITKCQITFVVAILSTRIHIIVIITIYIIWEGGGGELFNSIENYISDFISFRCVRKA